MGRRVRDALRQVRGPLARQHRRRGRRRIRLSANATRPRGAGPVKAGPTLYLTVGLPGAGKTTRAKALAARHRLLRLTPDDWMAPLFGESDAGGRRDILEGRMIWSANEVVRSGVGVILDFGCWSPQERYAIRAIAEAAGGRFEMLIADIDEAERRARATRRWESAPETTFPMTEADHDRFRASIVMPTPEEIDGPLPEAPEGFATWGGWAADRWPTLPVIDTR